MPRKTLNVAAIIAALSALATYVTTLPGWDSLLTTQGLGGAAAVALAALAGWLAPQPAQGRRQAPPRPSWRPGLED